MNEFKQFWVASLPFQIFLHEVFDIALYIIRLNQTQK